MQFNAQTSSSYIPSSSAQTAPSSSSPSNNSPGGRVGTNGKCQRKRSGCLTCRLRKKRCDEGKPSCGACSRLGLDCMGYESKRPVWMNKKEKVKDVTAQIKQTVNDTRAAKMRSHWANRAASASLTADGRSVVDTEEGINMSTRSENITDVKERIGMRSQAVGAGLSSDPLRSLEITDGNHFVLSGSTRIGHDTHFTLPSSAQTSYNPSDTMFSTQPTSPIIDPDILNLLGLAPTNESAQPYYPLYPQVPNTLWFPCPVNTQSEDMRYFHHYLTVILPLQYRFDNQPISDLVAPLALQHPGLLQALSSIAALHISRKRYPRSGNTTPSAINNYADPDDVFARTTLQATLKQLKSVPAADLGTDEFILAALTANSFNLFDGGEDKGWVETAELCRRCLTAVLYRSYGMDVPSSTSRMDVDIAGLMNRLGHLISPLMWVDILISLTQNKRSQFLPIYRVFLLDRYREQGKVSQLLRETVMGCDNTTRLALAETIALSEWKEKSLRTGSLSNRCLVEKADAIERLLDERRWREDHLFERNDTLTVHRMAMSNVFQHGVRVLLATVVDGCFPGVPDIVTAVQDTADALLALDKCDTQSGTDKLLIFPIVIAGCHAEHPALQRIFRQRFTRLGDEAAAFGNTSSALRLMEEVWRRRAAASNVEVQWRKVMFEMYEEGLLLI
ncbi:uncharacterized protein IL334_007441 [Kwoniella shivajii]|uniref:Zn(2)-C6 fungal-type domain-containing protein n=1 Tax=Kwoniella shivajii TaxID=564305 RepID=A0ABZ1D961_9TREE|nr:hypothetical protein IL334_007441 [Kwoniella shivajii]